MKFNSLAFRLFLMAVLWAVIVLPFTGYNIFDNYEKGVRLNYDSRLSTLLDVIQTDSMNTIGDEPVAPINTYEPLFEVTYSGWYWQIRPIDGKPGRTLVSPSLASSLLPSPYEKKFPTDDKGRRWSDVPGPNGVKIRSIEVIDAPGHDPNKTQYSVIVAGPIDWIEEPVTEFRNWLIRQFFWVTVLLLGFMLLQVRIGLKPLAKIEQGLTRIRSGQAERLDGQLPSEIEPLQSEINALMASNQEIIDRARTQVGNLAHALKTPLAVITNEARDDKSAFGRKVAEQAEIMRDQVGHYLDRARIAARAGAIGRVTPVDETVAPVVRALERINRDKGIVIHTEIQPGAKFQGEKQDLEEMLGNLLDNACKWGRQRVLLTATVAEGNVRGERRLQISVSDDGPGLSAEQRTKIGKRGVRLDETKPGSGLGLSIVSDLASSYRGTLELQAADSGGLKVVLDLPAA